LAAAGRSPTDYLGLTDRTWREAWLRIGGGEQGFAADIRVASQALARMPMAEAAGHLLRCALVASSLRSRHDALPPSVVAACVQGGTLSASQAEEHVALRADADSAAEVLTLLHRNNLATPAGPRLALSIISRARRSEIKFALLEAIAP